jgi:hypothetical protein
MLCIGLSLLNLKLLFIRHKLLVSSAIVVEKLAVELLFALQDFLGHSSLTLELVGLLIGNSFAALEGSEHSDCCSRRSWGGFAILDCMCWRMGCSWKDIILHS